MQSKLSCSVGLILTLDCLRKVCVDANKQVSFIILSKSDYYMLYACVAEGVKGKQASARSVPLAALLLVAALIASLPPRLIKST